MTGGRRPRAQAANELRDWPGKTAQPIDSLSYFDDQEYATPDLEPEWFPCGAQVYN